MLFRPFIEVLERRIKVEHTPQSETCDRELYGKKAKKSRAASDRAWLHQRLLQELRGDVVGVVGQRRVRDREVARHHVEHLHGDAGTRTVPHPLSKATVVRRTSPHSATPRLMKKKPYRPL